MHGKSSLVYYDEKEGDGLFTGLSNPFNAGRYHSLMIENDSFPGEALEVTAWTEEGLIMAARHKVYKHLQQKQKKMAVKQQRSLASVSINEMISALKDCEMCSFP